MARHRLVREAEGVALAANSAHGHDAAGEVVQLEPGSYRDRNGVVFYRDSRVFRGLSAKALANWERLSTAAFFREQIALGSIVATSRTLPQLEAELGGDWAAVLEHARIPFVSYPYEWTFGMLKDAALLHLDLLEAALGAGMILKDSSAYNIQWRGTQPIARQSKWKRHDNQEEDLGIAARACLSWRDDIASPFLIVVARRSRACFDGRT